MKRHNRPNLAERAKISLRRFGPAISILLVAGALAAGPVTAQGSAADSEARYQDAERYRTGDGVPVDLAKALALHEALVAEGYSRSLARLADIYERLGQFDKAIAAYGKAAEAGSDHARLQLAVGNVEGRFGPLSNPAAGFAMLRDIVNGGGEDLPTLYLADAYAAGQGTNPDIAQALTLYEKLAGRGYAQADARLGELYAAGTDVPMDLDRAIDHFGRAVAGGYDQARIGLSKALVEAGRGAEALPIIDAAVAKGTRRAEALRANWHYQGAFGALSDRALGAAELRRLAEAGDVLAARQALIAHERRSQRIRDLDLEKVLAKLQEAATAGDQMALLALARAYRELDWLIPQARERHRALVDQFGPAFGVDNEVPERLETLYDPKQPAASRQATYDYLMTQSGTAFEKGLMRLRLIEPTAYVFVLEHLLQDNGYATGKVDGTLDRKSLAAVKAFCRDAGIWDTCKHGPLNHKSAMVMVPALNKLRSGG